MKRHPKTVVVFDIRNFSAHRYHLGLKENKGAHLLQTLVIRLLECAVRLLNESGEHRLNYTGDGFVLVICGQDSEVRALRWISDFRKQALRHIAWYDKQLNDLFPELQADLRPLDYGIGAHAGVVKDFTFSGFRGEKTDAFLGSAVNIASRVEQCTKDYGYKAICTEKVLAGAVKSLKITQKQTRNFAKSLGKQRLRGFPTPFQLFWLKTGPIP